MHNPPFPSFGHPVEDETTNDATLSLQPLHASVYEYRETGPLCLFPGCGLIFPDHLALNDHQQRHNSHVVHDSLDRGSSFNGIYGQDPSRQSPFKNGSSYVNAESESDVATTDLGARHDVQSTYRTIMPDRDIDSCQMPLGPHTTPGHQQQPFAAFSTENASIDHQPTINHPGTMRAQYTTTAPPQMPLPLPAIPRAMPSRRHRCPYPGCNKSVSRPSDLNRHMLQTHQIGPKAFHCSAPGCDRKGTNGFARKDKMLDHHRAMHE